MQQAREVFDTALARIRHEVKGRLVTHGLFGRISYTDVGPVDQAPTGSTIEIVARGRSTSMSFERRDIESCSLRVVGPVLLGIISMVEELSVEEKPHQ